MYQGRLSSLDYLAPCAVPCALFLVALCYTDLKEKHLVLVLIAGLPSNIGPIFSDTPGKLLARCSFIPELNSALDIVDEKNPTLLQLHFHSNRSIAMVIPSYS